MKFIFLFLVAFGISAHAALELDYIGAPLTNITAAGGEGQGFANIPASMFGSISLNTQLGDDWHNHAVTPTAWSFAGNLDSNQI